MARKRRQHSLSTKLQPGLFDDPQLDLPQSTSQNWPPEGRFPLNISKDRRVGTRVNGDLAQSLRPLLIVGYSSLDHLISFFAEIPETCACVRVLFGSEPFPARSDDFAMKEYDYPAEVEEYWLSKGISLLLSARVIHARELLKQGRLQARYLGSSRKRLHAKIYCGDDATILGSSNYTAPGLERQTEANVRFTAASDKRRHREARTIAENFWAQGKDYNHHLDALLEKLLQVVSWQEALARGCAELLEGEWAKKHLHHQVLPNNRPLWPSQIQGIAQALWLIETVGSVLVADATGSGKTRMGVHLLRSILDRIWGSGRTRKGVPLIVCPPAVQSAWKQEATMCDLPLDTRSHGVLSRASSSTQTDLSEALRRAQILSVDEAHNFLNPKSARTRMLLRNMADHTVLFTATPINKSVVDLLRLADMLGADNLDDSTLAMFDKLLRRRVPGTLSSKELDVLRGEIQRFTVRRTKTQLNAMVDKAPDLYLDDNGRRCRFPEHHSKIYSLSESELDRKIAAQIRQETGQLSGISLIRNTVEMPEALAREGWTDEKYLEARLLSARRLAAYLVMVALRSSRAALLEHLIGTDAAVEESGLGSWTKQQVTGDRIGRLEELAGNPPGSVLAVDVPAWLIDDAAHRKAAGEEVVRYQRILELCRSLSTERETTKAQILLNLLAEHQQIVAFDSRPITLAYIAKTLRPKLGAPNVMLATGDSAEGKRGVRTALAPGSTRKGVVALCSDAMSEGINLQQASAIVHLDMPSVVRIAEQRVGRVDRMDSPHEAIEAWWPEDANEFALRTDERFVERYETVDSLLGSNMPLPEGLTNASRIISAKDLIQEYDDGEVSWDGLQDAFAPVRALVDGNEALVPYETYEHYRKVQAKVNARVSIIAATRPWAFFCIAGTKMGAPHWVFVESRQKQPITKLGDIAEALRLRLDSMTENLLFDDRAAARLERMLEQLGEAERNLLPRKKQRALEEMETVLTAYVDMAYQERCQDIAERLRRILGVFGDTSRAMGIDWNTIAEKWLDLVRPTWYERLLDRRRRKPLRLREIRDDLIGEKRLDFDAVAQTFEEVRSLPALHERVICCILGLES